MVRVTVLGSADAFGSGGRLFSAYLVEAPTATFLLECGPTVLQGLDRTGHDSGDIDFIVLSHMHGDHFGGVPFLFLEYKYERVRTRPLAIYGPPDTERRVRGATTALYENLDREPFPFALSFTELAAGASAEVQGVRIQPFAVPHAEELACVGYRLEIDGKVLVFSGDTGWTDALIDAAQGADLFLCECTTYETRLHLHLSYPEIAARAAEFGCRRLVLTHLGREPRAHAGELTIEYAEDGSVYEL